MLLLRLIRLQPYDLTSQIDSYHRDAESETRFARAVDVVACIGNHTPTALHGLSELSEGHHLATALRAFLAFFTIFSAA